MGMSQNSGGPKCLIFWMKNKIWGPPIGWETQLWYPILNIIRAQNQTTGQPSCCCQDDLLPPHDWKHANLEPLRQFLKEQAEAGSWSPRFREGLWAQVDGAFAHEGMGYFSCHMLHKQRWLLFKFVETWGTAAVCFHMAHQKKWLCAHCDYTLQSEIKHTAKEKSWVIVSNREWDVPNASFRLVKDPKGTSSSSKIVSKSWVIVSGPHPDNFKKKILPSSVIDQACQPLGSAMADVQKLLDQGKASRAAVLEKRLSPGTALGAWCVMHPQF